MVYCYGKGCPLLGSCPSWRVKNGLTAMGKGVLCWEVVLGGSFNGGSTKPAMILFPFLLTSQNICLCILSVAGVCCSCVETLPRSASHTSTFGEWNFHRAGQVGLWMQVIVSGMTGCGLCCGGQRR